MQSQNKRTVYVSQRIGRRFRWREAGEAVIRADGAIDVWMALLPVGGFNGHIHVARGTTKPTADDMPTKTPFEDEGFEI
jgi:hypothetical protein